MKIQEGPKVYDLPVANLNQRSGHYVPPPARGKEEAQRRRSNPPKSLILEAQTDGVRVLKHSFEAIADDEDIRNYFAREMGSVCLNTAWYSYANIQADASRSAVDNVGRRRLELPRHARIDDNGETHYETAYNNRLELQDELSRTMKGAMKLESAHKKGLEKATYKTGKEFGHMIGNLGLRLAATPLIGSNASAYEVQTAVRDAGREAIEQSRELHDGTYPTVAQLIDSYSQLSVQLHRTAPTLMRDALIHSTETIQELRRVENNV